MQITSHKTLGNVPDRSMIKLFTSVVGFLSTEAEERGWADISERLQEVESALAVRKGPRLVR